MPANLVTFNAQNEPLFVYPDTQPVEPEVEQTENEEEVDDREYEFEEVKKNTWQYSETLALIAAVENAYDDMHHPRKRKDVWKNISEILISQKISVSTLV